MTNFLKNHPMDNGKTSFCNGSNHLVNGHNLIGLENKLQEFSRSGKPLGTFNFGSFPYQQGKLSTSTSNLGLPNGEYSPTTIDQTLPDIYDTKGPLPQPYGRLDNARMMRSYGKRKSNKRKSNKRKSKKRKSKKRKSKKRKSKKRKFKKRKSKKFGTTPGTPDWVNLSANNKAVSNIMNKSAVAGSLSQAVGYAPRNIQYYEGPILNNQKPNLVGGPNVPANFSNNQLNSPYFNFGKNKEKTYTHVKPNLNKRSKISNRSFGSLGYGPNTVAYNKPFPIYNAGGNTVNFSTGKLYNPNILNNAASVQPDGMTPNAWLTQSVGNNFGKNIYSPNGGGSGRNVYMQPEPKYMNNKKLSTSFGGSVITLNSNGKVTVTKS